MSADASSPYAPLPDAPKGWGLKDALHGTKDDKGHVHCGKLDFPDQKSFNDFSSLQWGLGGTKEQLATLHYIETTGKTPLSEPVKSAPAGTSVDKLLDVSNKTPDNAGFYNLGTLRVKADEYQQFATLQKELCKKNPEALDTLYHMEHAPASEKPLTFRVTSDQDRNDRYDDKTNTISWNPNTSVRDKDSGGRVTPATAALHEETHWAQRGRVADTLERIPDAKYTSWSEKAVIDGSEKRDLALRGLPPRTSHDGDGLNVKGIDSVTPSLTVKQNGGEREVRAPFQQSGRIIEVDKKAGTVVMAVRGEGNAPEHRMEFKTEQLNFAAMGDNAARTNLLLEGAKYHKDTVSLQITNDGRVLYSDPAQEKRIHDNPQPGVEFPKPMQAIGAAPAAVPVGGGRDR